ncbi:unnamed protein product [Cuscuta campestris]|uniref:Uncharacterized protein n=1 Tax=Cuscuta campestris TaxID=132261 RepID=A0A484MB41_9ASTE|nr:unnamed protein product [Cuscuta campestris]
MMFYGGYGIKVSPNYPDSMVVFIAVVEEDIENLALICVIDVGQVFFLPHDPNSVAGAVDGFGETQIKKKFREVVRMGFGFNDGEDGNFVF